MELINEYICLTLKTPFELNSSSVELEKFDNSFLLTFNLSSKDCLLNILENHKILITINKQYFRKYDEQINFTFEKSRLSFDIQKQLIIIINCQQKGIHRQILLESIILFLIYQLQNNAATPQNISKFSKKSEVEKINLAKNYILENISKNITIPNIAAEVGTNQSYLKKGFKEIFNQTVFEFIHNNRMQMAKNLLKETDQTITIIASTVGYSSLSSFSQSYKKYFGITPSEEIKKKFSNY